MKPPAPISHPDQPDEALDKPVVATTEAGEVGTQALYALIARQKFFKGLTARHLQLLADAALEVRFETGEPLFQAGSPANRFYLILEGRVVLESEVAERGLLPIQTVGPGDDLGWSWLFPPYLLHFSARALEPIRAIFFYGTRLREQCEQDHELGYQLMRRIAEVLIQRLQATQQRLLECADPAKISAVEPGPNGTR